MKHTDFQIGDYVYHVNKIVKVATLSNSDVTLSVTDNLGTYFAVYNNIKPIPITSEILEKNGFKDTSIEVYSIRVGELEHISILFDTENLILDISNNIIGTILFHNKIEYVHELQHALRLCKIDKEIIL